MGCAVVGAAVGAVVGAAVGADVAGADVAGADVEGKNADGCIVTGADSDVSAIEDASFSSSLSSRYYFLAEIFPSDFPSYNSIYDIRFMFPSTVESYCYGAYSPSNFKTDDDDVKTGTSDTKTIQVDAGKQYIFKMDCKDYSIDVKEGILSD